MYKYTCLRDEYWNVISIYTIDRYYSSVNILEFLHLIFYDYFWDFNIITYFSLSLSSPQILQYTTLAFLKIYGLFIHLLLLYTYMYISKFINATCTVYIMLFVCMSSERTIVVLVPDSYACPWGRLSVMSSVFSIPYYLQSLWRIVASWAFLHPC